MQVRIARSAEIDLLEGFAFYERQQASWPCWIAARTLPP